MVKVVITTLCRKLAFATTKERVACLPIMSPRLSYSYSYLEGASGKDIKLTALVRAGILLLSMVS